LTDLALRNLIPAQALAKAKPDEKVNIEKARQYIPSLSGFSDREVETIASVLSGEAPLLFSPQVIALDTTEVDRYGRFVKDTYRGVKFNPQTNKFEEVVLNKTTEHYYGPFGHALSVTIDNTFAKTIPATTIKQTIEKRMTKEKEIESPYPFPTTEHNKELANSQKAQAAEGKEQKPYLKAVLEDELLKIAQDNPELIKELDKFTVAIWKENHGDEVEYHLPNNLKEAPSVLAVIKLILDNKEEWDKKTDSEKKEWYKYANALCQVNQGLNLDLNQNYASWTNLQLLASGATKATFDPKYNPQGDQLTLKPDAVVYLPISKTEVKTEEVTYTEIKTIEVPAKTLGPNITYDLTLYPVGKGVSPYAGPSSRIVAADIKSGPYLQPTYYPGAFDILRKALKPDSKESAGKITELYDYLSQDLGSLQEVHFYKYRRFPSRTASGISALPDWIPVPTWSIRVGYNSDNLPLQESLIDLYSRRDALQRQMNYISKGRLPGEDIITQIPGSLDERTFEERQADAFAQVNKELSRVEDVIIKKESEQIRFSRIQGYIYDDKAIIANINRPMTITIHPLDGLNFISKGAQDTNYNAFYRYFTSVNLPEYYQDLLVQLKQSDALKDIQFLTDIGDDAIMPLDAAKDKGAYTVVIKGPAQPPKLSEEYVWKTHFPNVTFRYPPSEELKQLMGVIDFGDVSTLPLVEPSEVVPTALPAARDLSPIFDRAAGELEDKPNLASEKKDESLQAREIKQPVVKKPFGDFVQENYEQNVKK
jgi:hypothetical protein